MVTISNKRLDELLAKAGEEVISVHDGNKIIAEKVEAIKQLLRDIKDVSERSGATVRLEYEFTGLIDEIGMLNSDWQSSYYNC
jgi:acetylglutamate kinase